MPRSSNSMLLQSWCWIPIPGPDGSVVGLFNFNFETTLKVVTARRLKVLQKICEKAMLAPTINLFGQNLLEVLADAQYEAPFAALYTCTETSKDDRGSHSSNSGSNSSSSPADGSMNFRINLMGSLGIPQQPEGLSHPMFPQTFHAKMFLASFSYSNEQDAPSPASSQFSELSPDFHAASDTTTTSGVSYVTAQVAVGTPPAFDWSPYIAQAMRVGYAVHVPQLPPDLVADIAQNRGWRDRIRHAVVIPIAPKGEGAEAAVLILGVNSRRPYNEIYSNWVDVLRMTLSSALSAVLGREAETRRADQLAQLDAAKTAFFSNASHELRTPLTLIDGPLNEALAMVNDRPLKEQLALAARNTARLGRLVDSLMDFSRVRRPKHSPSNL